MKRKLINLCIFNSHISFINITKRFNSAVFFTMPRLKVTSFAKVSIKSWFNSFGGFIKAIDSRYSLQMTKSYIDESLCSLFLLFTAIYFSLSSDFYSEMCTKTRHVTLPEWLYSLQTKLCRTTVSRSNSGGWTEGSIVCDFTFKHYLRSVSPLSEKDKSYIISLFSLTPFAGYLTDYSSRKKFFLALDSKLEYYLSLSNNLSNNELVAEVLRDSQAMFRTGYSFSYIGITYREPVSGELGLYRFHDSKNSLEYYSNYNSFNALGDTSQSLCSCLLRVLEPEFLINGVRVDSELPGDVKIDVSDTNNYDIWSYLISFSSSKKTITSSNVHKDSGAVQDDSVDVPSTSSSDNANKHQDRMLVTKTKNKTKSAVSTAAGVNPRHETQTSDVPQGKRNYCTWSSVASRSSYYLTINGISVEVSSPIDPSGFYVLRGID